MEKLVRQALTQHQLVRPGARVICALSGGADSIAMTHLMSRLGAQMGFAVSACHLNHQLRGEESLRDEHLVREFCCRQGIPLKVDRQPAAAYAAAHNLGLEEAARELRYAFFDACRLEQGADCVATAHTAEDQLETMLFQLCRGSGLRGMCGIPEKREYLIRPLLQCTREQIHQYIKQHKLPFCHDSSNDDLAFHRNLLRARVLPVLRQVNPRAAAHAASSAQLLREDEMLLTDLADRQVQRLTRRDAVGSGLDLAGYLRLPRPLQYRVLRQQLGGEIAVTAAQFEQIISLCRKNRGESQRYSLAGGWRVVLQGGLFRVETVSEPDGALEPRALCLGEETSFGRFHIMVRPACGEEIYNSVNLFGVSRDTIDVTSLQVRPRAAGDRLQRHAGGGHKSLSRVMIDLKIPRSLRDRLPVVADSYGVIAAAGVGANWDRLSPSGVDLTIEIKEGEL